MPAGKLDITIEQGATFSRTLRVQQPAGTALDLTGYTARAKVRETFDGAVQATFTCTITPPATQGIIVITLSAVQTAAIDFESDFGVYDVEIESGSSVVTRLLQGKVTLSREVTY